MFKTPAEYAKLMIDLFYGDHEAAQTEVYEAAKVHPIVPNRFWRDVAKAIEADAVEEQRADESEREYFQRHGI